MTYSSSTSSIGHCISRDCKLGAGIAKLFRQRFGRVDELRGSKVGEVSVLEISGRFIYNLVSKDRYWDRPGYEVLEQCLVAMREHALLHQVECIGLPRIGCGLDGLNWELVRGLLDKVKSDPEGKLLFEKG